MSQFHIQAISLNGSQYSGLTGVGSDYGWTDLDAANSGTVAETLNAQTRAAPTASFTTRAVGTWLTALNGSNWSPVVAISSSCILYAGKAADDTIGYASGSVHEAWTATAGLLYATALDWSDGGVCELMVGATFHSSSGSTNPLSRAAGALPTMPIPVEAWVVTGLSAVGNAITGLQSVRLEMNPKIQARYEAGLPFPTEVHGAGPNGPAEFRLSFDTRDLSAIGTGLASGTVVLTLTQVAQDGTLTSTTKTITLANCLLRDASGPINGSQGGAMVRSWIARPRYDGTTYSLTIA